MDTLILFYQSEFQSNKIPEINQRRLLNRAYAWLNSMAVSSAELRQTFSYQFNSAVCAAADAIYELELGGHVIKQENADLKLTFQSQEFASERQKVAAAAFPYLSGTGLLYCGVGKC